MSNIKKYFGPLFLIASVIIATILIKNKTKEIAILKTLGLSNRSIKKSFFLTGFTIGFVATLTGIILGVLFALNIEKIRNLGWEHKTSLEYGIRKTINFYLKSKSK